jgi:hypothetical protein
MPDSSEPSPLIPPEPKEPDLAPRAVLTPSPDAFSMLALVVPLWALLHSTFEVALFLRRRRTKGGGPGRGGEP